MASQFLIMEEILTFGTNLPQLCFLPNPDMGGKWQNITAPKRESGSGLRVTRVGLGGQNLGFQT